MNAAQAEIDLAKSKKQLLSNRSEQVKKRLEEVQQELEKLQSDNEKKGNEKSAIAERIDKVLRSPSSLFSHMRCKLTFFPKLVKAQSCNVRKRACADHKRRSCFG